MHLSQFTHLFRHSSKKHSIAGFTMIELLIIVAILALLGAAMFTGMQLQSMKARDARRKADLEKLKIAFENYYNDEDCYPPADVFNNGGGSPSSAVCNTNLAALDPYVKTLPCDPTTGMPYMYLPPQVGDVCDGYRLYTKLENNKDKSIRTVGCDQAVCGTTAPYDSYNYGIGIGASVPEPGFSP